MDKILEKCKDKLNDISRRNRSILLSRIVMKKTFDISTLGKIDKDLPLKIIENIVHKRRKVNLIDTNITSKEEEAILKSLNYLHRDVESIEKEKGYYECYLGYPFIQGNFHDGSFFRCPLFLYPVTISVDRTKNKMVLEPLKDSSPIINKTYFLAFNKYNKGRKKIDLKDLEEIENIEKENLFEWGKELFKRARIEVSTDNFSNESIKRLEPLSREGAPNNLEGKMEFLPLAIVGEFSQVNGALNSDYDKITSEEDLNDLCKALLGSSEVTHLEERFDEEKLIDHKEENNYFITKPDISQENVLIKSREGKGIVIHGPPGTGKSQVITNLISDNLFRKKKILVVCEKRAALDVVENRLASKGLDKFCLLVHDSENDRNEIFKKISDILNKYENDEYKEKYLSHDFTEIAKEFDGEIQELNKLIDLMHDKNDFGTILYNLYRTSERDYPMKLNLKDEMFDNVRSKDLDETLKKLSNITKSVYLYDDKKCPLYHRKPFGSDFNEVDFNENIEHLKKISDSIDKALTDKNIRRDIKRLSDLSFDKLCDLNSNLDYYQKKKKFTKIFNPRWIKIKKEYKELIKEGEIEAILNRWQPIIDLLESFKNKLSFLEEYFEEEFLELLKKNIISFKNNAPIFTEIAKLIREIDEIITLDTTKKELSDFEKEILVLCKEKIPLSKDVGQIWEKVIKNSFYLKWIDVMHNKNPSLRNFSYGNYSKIRNNLSNILDKKIGLVPELINEIYQKQYDPINLKDLIHDVGKKNKRLSMRQLIEKHSDNGLFDLFPCWLCSPETASGIFPFKKDLFDIVIFDESSQIKMEKVIPSLNRGKKIIVAGDDKQLPPTNFFSSSIDNETTEEEMSDDEQRVMESESLLVRAKSFLPTKRLICHYRSRHHELIDFSNHAFYDGDLRVSPRNEVKSEPPIKFVRTKGIWNDRCNREEAEEVVKLLKDKLLNNKEGLTFGIITFNSVQRDIIEELIDEESSNDPVFGRLVDNEYKRQDGDEYVGLFVKNIENVQGDERDVIIFSVGYGFDKSGRFRQSFGPLSGPYGGNRLNVAISRAKEKIYVFASFDSKDMKDDGKHEGPKLLSKYLKYCESVSNGDEKSVNSVLDELNHTENTFEDYDEYDSDFEGEVCDELRKLGYKVKTQIGCKGYKIDLGVLDPKNKNRFLAGIECDGATYHSSRSAKDRDIYRQSLLEDNGWKILRIWSRDWWKNSASEIKRIDRELKRLM